MSSSEDERPERMYRRGRPVIPVFEPEELLYRRCTLDEVDGEHLAPTAISFKGWSVNRGSLSEPEDVIVGFPGWGIARFKVVDVPRGLNTEGTTYYEIRVEHEPEENNYAHTEIRTYRNGQLDRRVKLSPTNREKLKAMKETFSRRIRVIRQPEIHASPIDSGI